MPRASLPEHQSAQADPDGLTAVGGWLFRWRTLLPVPLALLILLWPQSASREGWLAIAIGIALTALGEGLRLWGVHHIGTISRTRSERLGPLIVSGPFAVIRNPLYVGNIALWAGLALSARTLWLAPLIAVVLALEYHAIVRWEERLLVERHGDQYRQYASLVPRWIPQPGRHQIRTVEAGSAFSWRETLFSERGTLIAIAVGYALLWIKAQG